MTTEERKSANRMIACKIEGVSIIHSSEHGWQPFLGGYAIAEGLFLEESAWDECPDYFADSDACWRAIDSLFEIAPVDFIIQRSCYGELWQARILQTDRHPTETEGATRAEAIAEALYEYAKTL